MKADIRDKIIYLIKRVNIDPHECWNWNENRTYPTAYFDGNKEKAYRFSYSIFNGALKEGLVIDHLCRNPRCVNPEHLEQITNGENIRRGINPISENYKKTQCNRGHPFNVGNTYIRKDGKGRMCKACRKVNQSNFQGKQKDKLAQSVHPELTDKTEVKLKNPIYRWPDDEL